MLNTLKNIGVPKSIIRTYSAIAQSTDVFNNFLLDIQWDKQVILDFTATDLAALYIQLSDEFIDNVKKSY